MSRIYKVDDESVIDEWKRVNEHGRVWQHPRWLDVICHHCGAELGQVELSWRLVNIDHLAWAIVTCTHCKFKTKFILLNPMGTKDQRDRGWVFMFPSPPISIPVSDEQRELVEKTSPGFVRVYEQALLAEQLGHDEVDGAGFGKAFEFLLADYLRYKQPELKPKIEGKTSLGAVIKDIVDEELRGIAKRAWSLRHDETHSTRLWEHYDVHDLKQLIEITISLIVKDRLKEKYLKEMPERPELQSGKVSED